MPCPPGSLFCNPGGSIVQAGIITCSASVECETSHIPARDFYYNVPFYAFGNANDVFNIPSPWAILDFDEFSDGNKTFDISLHYNADGTRDWWTSINGSLWWISTDMARNWTRTTVQTANELWNPGDSMGGRTGLHQDLTGISWNNGTQHSGVATQPTITGHCYPWAGFNPRPAPATSYHVFTSDAHTGQTC